jgi:hypothetical protein
VFRDLRLDHCGQACPRLSHPTGNPETNGPTSCRSRIPKVLLSLRTPPSPHLAPRLRADASSARRSICSAVTDPAPFPNLKSEIASLKSLSLPHTQVGSGDCGCSGGICPCVFKCPAGPDPCPTPCDPCDNPLTCSCSGYPCKCSPECPPTRCQDCGCGKKNCSGAAPCNGTGCARKMSSTLKQPQFSISEQF